MADKKTCCHVLCLETIAFIIISIVFMGGEQATVVRQRLHSPEYLKARISEQLAEGRLNLSHQSNIWELIRQLKDNYAGWQITQLHLEHDMIAGEVVEELAKINFEKAEKALRVLALGHNDILCDHLKHFRGAYFNSLFMLYLDHNRIGSDGCFYLSKTSLQNLQTLDLSHNLINEKGAAHLANCNLPKLLNLKLADNQISYNGLLEFTKAHWPSLAFLQLTRNAFEPSKHMDKLQFRTEVNMFRLQLH